MRIFHGPPKTHACFQILDNQICITSPPHVLYFCLLFVMGSHVAQINSKLPMLGRLALNSCPDVSTKHLEYGMPHHALFSYFYAVFFFSMEFCMLEVKAFL